MSSNTVHVSEIGLHLEAVSDTEHALVLHFADDAEVVRIVGTVPELRAAAQEGLGLPIPALHRPAQTTTPAEPAAADEDRLTRLERAVETLTDLAERVRNRYHI